MEVKLIMFREDGRRRDFAIAEGATTIGRKDDCDIRVPLTEVSRRHAEIVVEGDSVTLRDLGAANGTFLNNRRITEEDMEPGDQIMVGPVVFTLQIDGDPAEDEMIKIRTRLPARSADAGSSSRVSASHHVATADDEVDPIAALEALASSADQTAINPEEDED